jgi:hypothetical protein
MLDWFMVHYGMVKFGLGEWYGVEIPLGLRLLCVPAIQETVVVLEINTYGVREKLLVCEINDYSVRE